MFVYEQCLFGNISFEVTFIHLFLSLLFADAMKYSRIPGSIEQNKGNLNITSIRSEMWRKSGFREIFIELTNTSELKWNLRDFQIDVEWKVSTVRQCWTAKDTWKVATATKTGSWKTAAAEAIRVSIEWIFKPSVTKENLNYLTFWVLKQSANPWDRFALCVKFDKGVKMKVNWGEKRIWVKKKLIHLPKRKGRFAINYPSKTPPPAKCPRSSR